MADTVPNPESSKRPPRDEKGPRTSPRAKTRTVPPKTDSSDVPKGTPRRGQDRKVQESLAASYQMFGGVLTSAGMVRSDNGLVQTGVVVIERSEMLAEAWMDLADTNPAIKVALRRFTEGSAVGGLILLHLTCAMPLLVDRGVIPPTAAAFAMGAPGAPLTNMAPSDNGNGSA